MSNCIMGLLFHENKGRPIALLAFFFTLWTTNVHSQSGDIPTLRDTAIKMRLKLLKVELTPHCGIIAWTASQKFEIVLGKLPDYPGRHIILLQKCPELLGPNFFEKNKMYDVSIFRDTSNAAGALNAHRGEKLPTYWCGRITKIY